MMNIKNTPPPARARATHRPLVLASGLAPFAWVERDFKSVSRRPKLCQSLRGGMPSGGASRSRRLLGLAQAACLLLVVAHRPPGALAFVPCQSPLNLPRIGCHGCNLLHLVASSSLGGEGALLDRRKAITAALAASFPVLLAGAPQQVAASQSARNTGEDDLVGAAAVRIMQLCGPYISQLRQAGVAGGGEVKIRLLYRGGNASQRDIVQREESDLLEEETYGREGSMYFQALQDWMKGRNDDMRGERLGHIAVANTTEAGIWGDAMSCWPVGDFDYLWLAKSRLLFDADLAMQRNLSRSMDLFRENCRLASQITATRITKNL